MKTLLVALVAMTMVSSAFADHHGENMIKLNGCFDGQCDNLDFRMSGNDVEDAEEKTQNIAINYARSFAGNWGAGFTYKTMSETTDGDVGSVGDKSNTIGLSGYWNKDGSWDNSCFAALHYDMVTNDDTEATKDSGNKQTVITLEYGHRYTLGMAMGVNFSWVPSVSYSMTKQTPNNDDNDDINSTDLRLNVANMAVTF